MKFKEGKSVEVLRKENDPCGAWFPGKVILVDGDKYTVRYKRLRNHKGEPVVERVHKEYVRPRPPHEKWVRCVVGDIVEVFDIHCWRVANIVKVLKSVHFVVRLFGSIQLREFHKSNLRIRQAWHDSKWSVVGKVLEDKQIANNHRQNYSEQPRSIVCRAPVETTCQGTYLREEDGKKHHKDWNNHYEMCLPVRTIKRSHAHCSEPSSKDPLMERSRKKRKSSPNAGGCNRPLMRNHGFFMQVDDMSSTKVRVDEKSRNKSTEMDAKMEKETNYLIHNSIAPLLSTEGSYQCSVASCSLNNVADYPGENSQGLLENISDNSDAESSFPSLCRKKHLPPSPGHKLEVDIHKLELQAYKSTVQALYASGPLSWEQESLLTNLRLSLHISNEEHLLQLRHLLSTQVL